MLLEQQGWDASFLAFPSPLPPPSFPPIFFVKHTYYPFRYIWKPSFLNNSVIGFIFICTVHLRVTREHCLYAFSYIWDYTMTTMFWLYMQYTFGLLWLYDVPSNIFVCLSKFCLFFLFSPSISLLCLFFGLYLLDYGGWSRGPQLCP